jgi:hypothetical protein
MLLLQGRCHCADSASSANREVDAMLTMRVLAAVVCGAALAVLLAGCGGSGGDEPTGLVAADGVDEYVGDGHHGTKPLPELLGLPEGQVRTQAAATAIALGFPPLNGKVPAKAVNWYRIPPVGVTRPLVVSLQPTHGEDSDLYVFAGSGAGYAPGATCLGSSTRLPTGGDDQTHSFVTDWVAFDAKPSSGAPAAQIAVWGVPGGATPCRYRTECSPVWGLTVNSPTPKGATVGYQDSHWYRFAVQAGQSYWIDVMLQSAEADVDIFAYLGKSTRYLGKSAVGGLQVDPGLSGSCYVRVYSMWITESPYTLQVSKM